MSEALHFSVDFSFDDGAMLERFNRIFEKVTTYERRRLDAAFEVQDVEFIEVTEEVAPTLSRMGSTELKQTSGISPEKIK